MLDADLGVVDTAADFGVPIAEELGSDCTTFTTLSAAAGLGVFRGFAPLVLGVRVVNCGVACCSCCFLEVFGMPTLATVLEPG